MTNPISFEFPDIVCGRRIPERSRPVGYAALITTFDLMVPAPDQMFVVGEHHSIRNEHGWRILTPRHHPSETLIGHLEFALRYEGVDLAVLHALFRRIDPAEVENWVIAEPTGRYARRAWFLYEWLTEERLNLPDAVAGPYIGILDPEQQCASSGETVTRHRVRNNLPGTPEFCPLVRRTEKLNAMLDRDLIGEASSLIKRVSPSLMARAAAFMLLEDSKASYVIEGETPPQDRLQRWGRAIGEAGREKLTEAALLRLQRLVIGDSRFVHIGWRKEGGFIGSHDRNSGTPIPVHISAKSEDLPKLLKGLFDFIERNETSGGLDPIVTAAVISFGFVFIHPFEDGNGRLHRWMIHHVLNRRGVFPSGVGLPISPVMLDRIDDYRSALESHSKPRLALTEWNVTPRNNVQVVNETRDHFRFFDATHQAEFLAECVVHALEISLPAELDYLQKYDQFKRAVSEFLELPGPTFDLMVKFLRQNNGRFSRRALTREFQSLSPNEVTRIQDAYREAMIADPSNDQDSQPDVSAQHDPDDGPSL